MNAFSIIFLVALGLSLGVRLWLAGRQIHHVAANRDRVPEPFAAHIPLEAHRKAADYTVAKTRLSAVGALWDGTWLLIWTIGGGLALLDTLWSGLGIAPLWTGVGVLVSASLLMGLLDLPLAAYRSFVIEERFGFNRMTPRLWLSDVLKSALLLTLLGGALAVVFLWVMEATGRWWWLLAWLVWLGFTLAMTWAYPTLIAPLFNRFQPLDDEALRERIRHLLERSGFASQGIYVMDGSARSSHGNAYFTGLGRNKRIVFFDTLLRSLEPTELEAVLAHELGHYRRHHVRKGFLLNAAVALAALALLGWLMQQGWFYRGLGLPQASDHGALMLFLLAAPVFAFFTQPVFARLSRRHEFEADEFASEQTDGRALIGALVTLYRDNHSTVTPDPVHSAFYDSHPPASARIAHLETKLAHP